MTQPNQPDPIATWMESLDFVWNGEAWQTKERFVMPMVYPKQAAFFYRLMLRERLDTTQFIQGGLDDAKEKYASVLHGDISALMDVEKLLYSYERQLEAQLVEAGGKRD